LFLLIVFKALIPYSGDADLHQSVPKATLGLNFADYAHLESQIFGAMDHDVIPLAHLQSDVGVDSPSASYSVALETIVRDYLQPLPSNMLFLQAFSFSRFNASLTDFLPLAATTGQGCPSPL